MSDGATVRLVYHMHAFFTSAEPGFGLELFGHQWEKENKTISYNIVNKVLKQKQKCLGIKLFLVKKHQELSIVGYFRHRVHGMVTNVSPGAKLPGFETNLTFPHCVVLGKTLQTPSGSSPHH